MWTAMLLRVGILCLGLAGSSGELELRSMQSTAALDSERMSRHLALQLEEEQRRVADVSGNLHALQSEVDSASRASSGKSIAALREEISSLTNQLGLVRSQIAEMDRVAVSPPPVPDALQQEEAAYVGLRARLLRRQSLGRLRLNLLQADRNLVVRNKQVALNDDHILKEVEAARAALIKSRNKTEELKAGILSAHAYGVKCSEKVQDLEKKVRILGVSVPKRASSETAVSLLQEISQQSPANREDLDDDDDEDSADADADEEEPSDQSALAAPAQADCAAVWNARHSTMLNELRVCEDAGDLDDEDEGSSDASEDVDDMENDA